jgi:hypothetical protein|tara:strand:- start:203 stop:373 length:171 start_codon:yes stop_codon:yes gene_type:complete
MRYKLRKDKPTDRGVLYKGTIIVTESNERYNGKLRGKDPTGVWWYLDKSELELIGD